MRIGILGGGQLGRMLALAGLPMGFKFRVLDPTPSPPAAIVAEHILGEYEDHAALADFVSGLDVVTYEFENVPVAAARWLADRVPVNPPPDALEAAQDRLTEKMFFQHLGVPTPPFRAVNSRADLDNAAREIGLPAVLKTRRFGYDGKGQMTIRDSADVDPAWERLGGRPLIFEQFVSFDREVSLLAVRGQDRAVAAYPLIENYHQDGILRRSIAPVVDPAVQELAEQHVRRALEQLKYVGVMAVEFFQLGKQLFVNEMAPRVHNSGHWTIEGAATSQFANHIRAIAGLPLGETRVTGAVAMINLIGELPDEAVVLRVPGSSFHNYGKSPRPNRKVGHVAITACDYESLQERLNALAKVAPATITVSR
jgi:5-(carboxyamino)imidazole ribonucleotide synthase